MKSTEATVFDRKSGEAEGPAVRPGSRTKVSVPLVLPQTRHPACPGVPWNRSEAQWRDLLFLFPFSHRLVILRGCDFFGLLHRQQGLGAPFKPVLA
jgi:hypothetical protein